MQNINCLQAHLFCYENIGKESQHNYLLHDWYQEHKIVYTDKTTVIAYENGYRCKFAITVYTFHDITNAYHAKKRLGENIKRDPVKYRGWQHHINFYTQKGKGKKGDFVSQLKFD